MVRSPREPHSIQRLKRSASVLSALAVVALAACGTPFEASPTCGAADPSCAGSADELTEAGGAGAGGPATAQGGEPTSQGGMADEPGTPGEGGAPSAGGDASSIVSGAGAPSEYPLSCQDARNRDPNLPSGLVTIDPDGSGPLGAFEAHCDMASDDGGWTQIGVGEYWQKNDLKLAGDSVLPWAELTALLANSTHLFRAGDGTSRLYVRDEAALIEKINDPAGTNSPQPWVWRSNAASIECAKAYSAISTSGMLKVTTKAITCEPLGFGEHTCGVAAGWILFHRNDTANWSGKNPCGLAMAKGGTPEAPTASSLRPLWLR